MSKWRCRYCNVDCHRRKHVRIHVKSCSHRPDAPNTLRFHVAGRMVSSVAGGGALEALYSNGVRVIISCEEGP